MAEMNFVNENISPVDELQQIITDNVEWLRPTEKNHSNRFGRGHAYQSTQSQQKDSRLNRMDSSGYCSTRRLFWSTGVVFGDGQHRRARLSGST